MSFATNTNWQGYVGESTMSYLTQMLGLAVQNFLSAASGMAVLVALIRGFARRQVRRSATSGWISRAVPSTSCCRCRWCSRSFSPPGRGAELPPYRTVTLIDPVTIQTPVTNEAGEPVLDAAGQPHRAEQITEQTVPLGPAASQIAIKQLGTNGGGFFNVNSAHPLENPTPLSNFLQVLAILLIPAALCYTFGRMVRTSARAGRSDRHAGDFRAAHAGGIAAEQSGNPQLRRSVSIRRLRPAVRRQHGRQGDALRNRNSALWASATTAASNGSVNSMHGSFTPLGGLIPMWLMQLGEVVFGGVGSGLYGMLMFAIVAVFIAGLMVGRTPEYLGKKVESFEIEDGVPDVADSAGGGADRHRGRERLCPRAPRASAILARMDSPRSFTRSPRRATTMAARLPSISANTPFYNTMLGIAMWISRYWLMIPVLAIAGSLAAKRATAGPRARCPPTRRCSS